MLKHIYTGTKKGGQSAHQADQESYLRPSENTHYSWTSEKQRTGPKSVNEKQGLHWVRYLGG